MQNIRKLSKCSDGNVSTADIIPGIFKWKSKRVKVSGSQNTIDSNSKTLDSLIASSVYRNIISKRNKYYLYLLASGIIQERKTKIMIGYGPFEYLTKNILERGCNHLVKDTSEYNQNLKPP